MSKKNDIRLLRVNYLRGPNLWTYRPVLETWLDLGELEDWPSNRLPGCNERLTQWLPALVEHHCGVGERGGFLQRLEEGTWAGHVLEHVVIELLNLAGMPTAFGQTRSTSQRGVYRMVFRARDEQVARRALAHGHRLLMAAINDEPFDLAGAVADITEQVDRCYLGPSTAAIVAAATDRQIPHIRLNEGNLVQLGYGARQRRIWTAQTDRTSAIAQGIAGDKDLTKRLVAGCGVPVPEGRVVATPAEAWEAAQDIGLPVAVKPTDGNHGRGVMLDLRTQEEVEAAFPVAEQQGSEVLVERYIPGDEHRLLVVNGEVVAAARGETAWVTGDGRSTVRQLVDAQLNSDPRRGESEDHPLNRLVFEEDDVMLGEVTRQGLTPEAVPEAGRKVLIQRNGNLAIDCTDRVHPEVEHMAALAARIVGLDIAGIDLVAQDIGRPLHEQGGAIVEVNAGPGLLMHLKPAVGKPRPVGRAIVEALFPRDGEDPHAGRVPIVGIAGTRGTTRIARLVAWLAQLRGLRVGLACADGLYLDRRRLAAGDARRWDLAHRLLVNRNVEAAVFENDAGCVLRDGLAYDRCTVGVVTDMDGFEALAEFDVQTPEQMPKVLRTQIDVVLDDGVGVLNAGDERVAALGELCDGEVILYAADARTPALQAHRAKGARGGRVVFLQGGRPVLATGSAETRLAPLSPAVRGDMADDILLAAVAAGWALDIPPDLIIAGIETFDAHNAAP
ncbi:cyanophycin synthetase [Ramlibacter rhizophilus]|uniref:Cyanophycin synthetase n=1 Tax=Ramlibacter rhizophilus TaxID=1781167 RepID=A0A4Z0C2R0_9BURK|nr:cyanophycin synthetase [Ramlibacter rhizophilus]TFZ04479.1 cyanophycin synthetase [Ramlibacter rhizophilus]